MKASELDELFDEGGEDVLQYFDLSKSRRSAQRLEHANIDLPVLMLRYLDEQAGKLGITRQALVQRLLEKQLPSISEPR